MLGKEGGTKGLIEKEEKNQPMETTKDCESEKSLYAFDKV